MALNNVPVSGQDLNTTRPLINSNFSVIDGAFTQDHVDYNIAGQGKHEQSTYVPNNTMKTFLVNEIGLFNNLSAASGNQEIFIQRNATGVGPLYPMTGYAFNGTGANTGGIGWTYLPSGYKMMHGTVTTSAGGTAVITYAGVNGIASFPGFTGDGGGNFVGTIQLTRVDNSGTSNGFPRILVMNPNLTSFTIQSSNNSQETVTWFVLGF